jgi:hypothetical protein
MANVLLYVPAGVSTVQVPGPALVVGANGIVSVPVGPQLIALLTAGCQFVNQNQDQYMCPLPPLGTDLTSIVAATIPVSGTPYTIAAQPKVALKLNVRGVYSGAVAGLVVNIVGIDGRGNTITEAVNVAAAASTTFITANAFAKVTSVTPVGTVTNVTTIGVGASTALALPLSQAFTDLVVYKEVKLTGAAGVVGGTLADEAVGTVDTVAGTVVPTTAADGSTQSYLFYYTWNSVA